MTVDEQVAHIQKKLRERTIGSPQPTHHVNEPCWLEPKEKR